MERGAADPAACRRVTGVLLASGTRDETLPHPNRVPIELRIEDSLRSISAPIRDVSLVMVGVLVGSLAFHAGLVATAIVAGRAPAPAPQKEITVEIVQEAPKPRTPVKPPPPPKIQQAKLETAKPDAAKPAPPAPAVTKPEPAKLETPKLETPKRDVTKPAPARPLAATAAPPVTKPATQPDRPPADTKEMAALQKELDELRAQRAALRTESPAPQAVADHGTGPLAGSMQAVALPSIGEDGEVVGYQDLVFSQLAKAKGLGDYHGQGGTTGVRFEVDAEGRLLRVAVAASSGNPALDQQALEIVRRASPFPPPPKDADHSFVANVNFVPPKR